MVINSCLKAENAVRERLFGSMKEFFPIYAEKRLDVALEKVHKAVRANELARSQRATEKKFSERQK